jgi:DNA-binding NarL/FixJ family response regulator
LRPIRLVLVHDNGLALHAIRLALEACPELEIVGHANYAGEPLPRSRETRPDVVLLDVGMLGADGLRVLDRMHERYPASKIVLLSVAEDTQVVAEALRRGATAVVGKGIDPAHVVPLVLQVADGPVGPHVFAHAIVQTARRTGETALTEREREIVESVAAGRSNREIAGQLMLSERTIKYHLTHVYRKLGVAGRTEAAKFVHDHGLMRGREG